MFSFLAWAVGYFVIGTIITCIFKRLDVYPLAPEHLHSAHRRPGRGTFHEESNAEVGLLVLTWPLMMASWLIYWFLWLPIKQVVKCFGWLVNNCKACERK